MGPYFRTLTEITLFRSTFLRDLYNFVLWVHILEPLQRFHFFDPHFKGTITIFYFMGPYFTTITGITLLDPYFKGTFQLFVSHGAIF